MSRTGEISSRVQTLATAAGRSHERAGSGLALADRQIARCRISGWNGVIRSLGRATEPLETVRAGLAAMEESCGTTQTLLDAIPDEPQQGEVTRRLAAALTELRAVMAVLDGLSIPADEAVQWAALAVGDTLERWTREIHDSLETLRVQAARCVADLEAEFALASEAGAPEP